MRSIADGSVKIQTTLESNPSTLSWFGEVVLLIGYLHKHGELTHRKILPLTGYLPHE